MWQNQSSIYFIQLTVHLPAMVILTGTASQLRWEHSSVASSQGASRVNSFPIGVRRPEDPSLPWIKLQYRKWGYTESLKVLKKELWHNLVISILTWSLSIHSFYTYLILNVHCGQTHRWETILDWQTRDASCPESEAYIAVSKELQGEWSQFLKQWRPRWKHWAQQMLETSLYRRGKWGIERVNNSSKWCIYLSSKAYGLTQFHGNEYIRPITAWIKWLGFSTLRRLKSLLWFT